MNPNDLLVSTNPWLVGLGVIVVALGAVLTIVQIRKGNAEARLKELEIVERQRAILKKDSVPTGEREIALAGVKFEFLQRIILNSLWFGAAILTWKGALAIVHRTVLAFAGYSEVWDGPGTPFGAAPMPEVQYTAISIYLAWHPLLEQLGVSVLTLSFGIPIMLSIRRYLREPG